MDGYAILIVFLTLTGDVHLVVDAEVAHVAQPLHVAAPMVAAFDYRLTDGSGNVLANGSFDDPRIQRGTLPPRSEPEAPHAVTLVDSTSYVLRMPYAPGARFLEIEPAELEAERPTAAPQVLDLAPFL